MAGDLILLLSSGFGFFLLLILVKFLQRNWWRPMQIQNAMKHQGIRGPAYKLIHGNTKEIEEMGKQALMNPMDISHHILPKAQPHLYSWLKLYGSNCLYWYGTQPQLVITEPQLVREILNNAEAAFPNTQVSNLINKLLGHGIVLAEGEKWYRQRKIAVHAFLAESLKGMIPEMISSTASMLQRWKQEEGKEMEVYEEFKTLTSEIISKVAFGGSYLEGRKFFSMLMQTALIIARNRYRIQIPGIGRFFKTDDDIQSDKLEQQMRSSCLDIITKRNQKVLSGESDNYGSDFLGLLLEAYHNNDRTKRISIDDAIDDCKTIFAAGYETTSSLLTWTYFLLAINTDWQEKARKEIVELFGDQNPNPEGIARMKILTMIINESLRLYPPIIDFLRKAQRDIKVGSFIVPANMNVEILTLALHHDPKTWGEDVHLFKPERFAEGVAKATNNGEAAFVPFGLGPRNCLGMNLAIIETKIVLAMSLQRYKFTLSPKYVHSPVVRLTLGPLHGVQIMLQKL